MQDVLQNRKRTFLLKARTAAADVRVHVGPGLPRPAILLLAASRHVLGPCKQHPANEKQTPSKREAKSSLQMNSPGKPNRFSNKVLALFLS